MTISTFETITNRKTEVIPGGIINNGCGPTTVPDWGPAMPNPGAKVVYESKSSKTYIHDPTKGRKWRKPRLEGKILMSEYARGSIKTTRDISSIDRSFTHASYFSTGKCPKTKQCATFGPVPATQSWTENFHIGMLSTLKMKGQSYSDLLSQVEDAKSSTQQQAFAAAMSAYDLLTEIGEAKETFSYLFSKVKGSADLLNKFRDEHPVAYEKGRRRNAKSLLRSGDARLRKMGGRWMEYRYAIMPLVYSMKDITSLLDSRGAMYHTERAKELIKPSGSTYIKTDNYLSVACRGTIEVRSMTKAAYELGSLQRLFATIGMNPFRTAWELIPLSFVVDWFLNVGDALSAATSLDYSSQRMGCTVVRTNVIEEIRHHRLVRDHVYWEFPVNQCGYRPPHWDVLFSRDYDNIVQITEMNLYDRTLWRRPEPALVYSPFLNWKRFIDAAVLGYQPTKKLLRSLK